MCEKKKLNKYVNSQLDANGKFSNKLAEMSQQVSLSHRFKNHFKLILFLQKLGGVV